MSANPLTGSGVVVNKFSDKAKEKPQADKPVKNAKRVRK
jgi:hypothetical protein